MAPNTSTITVATSDARWRIRWRAVSNAASTRSPKRPRSTPSWPYACTVRISCSASSTYAPTSPMRSWLARASFFTRRPKRMIGATTTGTPASTSSVSLVLVIASITRPPTSSRRLRTAIDALDPTTVSSIAVSLVRRDITSPVRVTSNQPGGSRSRWSNTDRRRSAVTRSPIHDTK